MIYKYRVLWFDDECKDRSLLHVIKRAKKNDIELVGFSSAQEGIPELRNNYSTYDALLLDGMFFEKENQDGDNVDEQALSDVLGVLREIPKLLSPFLLSGKASFTKDNNPVIKYERQIHRIYDKNSEEDFDDLWNDIKVAADSLPETQIRHEFVHVFEVCTDNYIGEKNRESLLNLLLFLKGDVIFNEEKFNSIRKLFEAVLKGCYNSGLIHEDCINKGKINLAWSLLFLQGKEVCIPSIENCRVKLSGPKCMPDIISDFAYKIKEYSSVGSHYESDICIQEERECKEKDITKLADLKSFVNTPYILKSLIYQLLDVLLWYKSYIEYNSCKKKNKDKWNKEQILTEDDYVWVEGDIVKIKDNSFGIFKSTDGVEIFILPTKVKECSLVSNQRIKVHMNPNLTRIKIYTKDIKVL